MNARRAIVDDAPQRPAAASQPPTRRRARRPVALLVAGWLLVLTGLAGGGYVAWELYGNPLMDPVAASEEVTELRDAWVSDATPTVPEKAIPGNAIALLRIPDFGPTFEVPVLKGTTNAVLARGIGWFEGTVAPGKIGNFAVAGHRGARGPFVPLPGLQPGARVEVETVDAVYIYALDNHPADTVVNDTESWVLDPVPGQPKATATEARITLVTCSELFHSPLRAVAFGHLVAMRQKGA